MSTPALLGTLTRAAAQLHERTGAPVAVLDLGGGTGTLAVPLAQQGHHVTVVDPSADALAALARRAREGGIEGSVVGIQGDSDTLAASIGEQRFDLVCCHETLEFVDSPAQTLAAIAVVLSPGGVLSLVLVGRLAEALSKTVAGDFARARAILTDPDGRWGAGDPLPRRFDLDQAQELLGEAGFTVDAVEGVGVLRNLVPSALVASDQARDELAQLENLLVAPTERAGLRVLGESLHVLARRT